MIDTEMDSTLLQVCVVAATIIVFLINRKLFLPRFLWKRPSLEMLAAGGLYQSRASLVRMKSRKCVRVASAHGSSEPNDIPVFIKDPQIEVDGEEIGSCPCDRLF